MVLLTSRLLRQHRSFWRALREVYRLNIKMSNTHSWRHMLAMLVHLSWLAGMIHVPWARFSTPDHKVHNTTYTVLHLHAWLTCSDMNYDRTIYRGFRQAYCEPSLIQRRCQSLKLDDCRLLQSPMQWIFTSSIVSKPHCSILVHRPAIFDCLFILWSWSQVYQLACPPRCIAEPCQHRPKDRWSRWYYQVEPVNSLELRQDLPGPFWNLRWCLCCGVSPTNDTGNGQLLPQIDPSVNQGGKQFR